jgi:hypothetical protein
MVANSSSSPVSGRSGLVGHWVRWYRCRFAAVVPLAGVAALLYSPYLYRMPEGFCLWSQAGQLLLISNFFKGAASSGRQVRPLFQQVSSSLFGASQEWSFQFDCTWLSYMGCFLEPACPSCR